MDKRPGTPWERIKRVPLWQWGLLCILCGVAIHVQSLLMPLGPVGGSRAYQQGVAMGRASAELLPVVIGAVLIVLHFARGNRGS